MALFAATDFKILINAVDMGTMATAANLDVEADTLETTAFGATAAWRTFIAGLKKGMLTLVFNQDFAAAQANATLWPLFGAAPTTFEIRPTSAARSATNPGYTGSLLVTKWAPVSGKVGDLAVVSVSFPVTGPVTQQIA
jgi:hypothetical protein